MKVKINEIKIKERHRKDFGDISDLAESIKNIGLLHPPVINEENILVAGHRRLKALESLGYNEIEVNKINIKDIIKGEYDENAIRKDFTMSEKVSIWNSMKSFQGKPVSESDTSGMKRRERASKFLGVSTDTLSKAKQIIESEDEELINALEEEKPINVIYKKLKKEEERKKIKESIKETKLENVFNDDALNKLKTLPSEHIDLCIIDPPYNIGFKSVRGADTNDFNDNISMEHLEDIFKELHRVLKTNSHFYCFIGFQTYGDFKNLIEKAGFEFRNCLIWVKNNHTPTNFDYYYAHQYEMIIFATKGKRALNEKLSKDVLYYDNIQGKIHNSEKPVELLEYLINNSSLEGELILDCFAGSGSTGVASKKLNRSFLLIEKERDFYEIILNRLMKVENEKQTN